MPVVLSIPHPTYGELLGQGGLAASVDGLPCPSPGCDSTLRLTRRRAVRRVVWVKKGEFVQEAIDVGIANCQRAGGRHWYRILPSDVLPYKAYSATAQEAGLRSYLEGAGGLRKAAGRLAGVAPHYSPLHGWLPALWESARGRDEPRHALPAGA